MCRLCHFGRSTSLPLQYFLLNLQLWLSTTPNGKSVRVNAIWLFRSNIILTTDLRIYKSDLQLKKQRVYTICHHFSNKEAVTRKLLYLAKCESHITKFGFFISNVSFNKLFYVYEEMNCLMCVFFSTWAVKQYWQELVHFVLVHSSSV